MYIITPNICYNIDNFACFYNVLDEGEDNCCLVLERANGQIESIRFDCPGSAIRAFDGIVKGLAEGCQTVYLQEVYLQEGSLPSLVVDYNRVNKTIIEKETFEEVVLPDPRHRISLKQ